MLRITVKEKCTFQTFPVLSHINVELPSFHKQIDGTRKYMFLLYIMYFLKVFEISNKPDNFSSTRNVTPMQQYTSSMMYAARLLD
jgi:hypothetical protein